MGVSASAIFGKVLAEGPVLHVGNAEIVRYTSLLPIAPMKVYIAFGGREWDVPGATDAQVKLICALETNLKNALLSPSEVLYVYDADAKHNEQAWAKRLPQALTFLFPAPK